MTTKTKRVIWDGKSPNNKTVIFPDRNISPSYFKDAPADSLLVRTIFYTIQGEGPLAGCPAVFIRLGGCNLGAKGVEAAGCEWCDTDFRISKSKWMTFEEIEEKANQLIAEVSIRNSTSPHATTGFRNNDPLYIITGGEPMLQGPALSDFIFWTNWSVQIETNGMHYSKMPPKTLIVVSPKLGKLKKYPPLSAQWMYYADYLKFVLEADPNSPYYTVPEYAYEFIREHGYGSVFVSPIAVYAREMTDEEGERASIWGDLINGVATAKNYQYAAEYALRNNLRLSMQTHLFANMP